MTPNPEEACTGVGTIGSGVEGIATINERKGFVFGREAAMRGRDSALKQFGENKGEPGGGLKRGEFGESSGREGWEA